MQFSLFLLLSLLLFFPYRVKADTMKNNEYQIHIGGSPTPSAPVLSPTQSPTPTPIKAGYQAYFNTNQGLSLLVFLSPDLVDFGRLNPTTPVTRTQTLLVQSISNYSVVLYSNYPLGGNRYHGVIPDTRCDDNMCSEQKATPWTNTLTFGLGFRCEGTNCIKDFIDKTTFRQVADQRFGKNPQVVIQANPGKSSSEFTYKVNIARSQLPDFYTTTFSYIVLPSL